MQRPKIAIAITRDFAIFSGPLPEAERSVGKGNGLNFAFE
jgi:hypothetical protein